MQNMENTQCYWYRKITQALNKPIHPPHIAVRFFMNDPLLMKWWIKELLKIKVV